MRNTLRLVPLALLLFAVGCALQSPEEVAEAQFRAWVRGDSKSFNSYFTSDGAETRKNALLARSDTVMATYESTGETAPLMYFVQGDPYGVPMGLSMFPPETMGFTVISSTVDGHQAVVEAELLYPDRREMMKAMGEAMSAQIAREGVDAAPFDARFASDEERAAYEERFRALALEVYNDDVPRLRRTQRARYLLERSLAGWRVIEEPVTAALLEGRSD